MHVFLLMIIPLVYFVNEYLCRNRKIDRDQLFCIAGGLIIACIYVMIDFFAVGSNHLWINTISSVWGYYLLSETLLPVCICIIPVFVAKDVFRNKIRYVFPVMTAFYAIFLPYRIISQAMAPDGFLMICYPLMMAAMIFNIDTAAGVFEKDADIENYMWLRCLVAGIAVVTGWLLPSAFAAVWFLNRVTAGTWILMVLFLLLSAGLRFVADWFLKSDR